MTFTTALRITSLWLALCNAILTHNTPGKLEPPKTRPRVSQKKIAQRLCCDPRRWDRAQNETFRFRD